MYRLVEEPTGLAYRGLLDFTRKHARQFTLVLVGSGKKSSAARRVLEDLSLYFIERHEASEWPGTELMEGFTGTLHRYQVSDGSIEFLKSAAPGLYAWHAPGLPDDLCFYRADGTALLSSVAHERSGELYLAPDEREELRRVVPVLDLSRVHEN